MDLLTQLNNAVQYIEEHICDDIVISDVSKVTSYSPYHFGRLFYYIAEMPLSEYVRKRRLSCAAMELQESHIKIIDLAVKYAYDSADSFTRAFVKQHNIVPSLAWKTGVMLKIFPPLSFQIKIQGVHEMNWRMEEKEAFEVFGIEKIFPSDKLGEVPDFWTECQINGSYKKLEQDAVGASFTNRPSECLVNALANYADVGENLFSYMLCAVKGEKSKTEGYTTFMMPKATWAVFRREDLKDHMDCKIPELFHRAYSEWLPSSAYDKADKPDIEIYGDDFEEVWISVVKK